MDGGPVRCIDSQSSLFYLSYWFAVLVIHLYLPFYSSYWFVVLVTHLVSTVHTEIQFHSFYRMIVISSLQRALGLSKWKIYKHFVAVSAAHLHFYCNP